MKNKLPYEATSKAIQGYSESVIAKSENNDCVVRAFAEGFWSIPNDSWVIGFGFTIVFLRLTPRQITIPVMHKNAWEKYPAWMLFSVLPDTQKCLPEVKLEATKSSVFLKSSLAGFWCAFHLSQ